MLFVTGNNHKFEEVSKVLQEEFNVSLEQGAFSFIELDSGNLDDIAVDKAKQAFRKFRIPLIVDDTGLFFNSYKNFPGVNPKWVFDSIGYDGIFRLLQGKSRRAFFQTCLCYFDGKTIKIFSDTMKGTITERVIKPKKASMPYNRIFVPDGADRALVEMPLEQMNKYLQRAKCARKLGKWLQDREEEDFIENV